MARIPFATWRGDDPATRRDEMPNDTPGGIQSHMGMVCHIMQGTLAGTDSWFHNPAARASAHAGVGKDGALDQWVDSEDRAWAEAAGNPFWFSVELEGCSGEPMTPAQLATMARIYRWGHELWDWPAVVTDNINVRGLGWHGMGGARWGGHYDCPGEPVKAQRSAVLAAAFPTPTTVKVQGGVDMAMPRTVPDPKAAADAKGRTPNWEVDKAGNIYCWDGSRQLKSLNQLTPTHPEIVDIALDEESGDGLILYGNDGRFEDGVWARSTYKITVGM